MKTAKSISGMVVIASFLAVTAFQSNSIAGTKPTGQTKHIDLRVSGMICSQCSKSLEMLALTFPQLRESQKTNW